MTSISRRSLLKGSAVIAGAGAVGLGFNLIPAEAQFNSDLDILNYALTLEHLEYAFYRDGLAGFGASDFNFASASARSWLLAIRDHEGAHVQTLTSVIQSLGGTPVSEARYSFPYTDARSFLGVAAALENTGVSAYDGAIRFVQNADLAEAAATIATVEARHAAYLNILTGASPFPSAFDDPKTVDEILAIAGPFIVGTSPAPSTTAPVSGSSVITSPTQSASAAGFPINGSVTLASGQYYKVEIRGGQFSTNWVTVGQTHTTSVSNGVLETLGPVAPGRYDLRVVIVGNGNVVSTSATVSVTLQ